MPCRSTMVGPNPLAYSREPSGENFTATELPAGLRIETADIQIQEHRVSPRRLARGRRARATGVPSTRRALRTGIRRPSTRRLPPPYPAPRRSSRPSGPRRRHRALLSAGSRSETVQGSDVSLNATAPVTGSIADVTTILPNGEYSPSCDRSSRSNRRTSWSPSITDARVPSSASDILTGDHSVLLDADDARQPGCAREDAHEVDACLGTVPELDGLHGEQQRAVEVRLLERERGDAPCLGDGRALPCEVRLEPREEARRDSDDRETGCAGRHPGQARTSPLFAQLSSERPRVLRSHSLRRHRGTLVRPP